MDMLVVYLVEGHISHGWELFMRNFAYTVGFYKGKKVQIETKYAIINRNVGSG